MADISSNRRTTEQLTVIEAADLVKQLEDKWGVTAAAPVAVAAAGGAWRRRSGSGGGSQDHV